jgi:magnesium-transporting ATPase (P-type)
MHLSKTARSVWTDGVALLAVLIIGLIGFLAYHVPLAITLWQVVVIELLILAYPIKTLQPKNSRKHEQPRHQAIFEIITFGLLAAAIAYLNYRLFFGREGFSPAYIDTGNPLYAQATTLACLTISLCQLMNLGFIQADTQKHFHLKQPQLQALAVSLFALLNIIYNPWLHGLFGTKALGLVDWLTALAAVVLYSGLRLLQRHTRQHTRHAVIKLHHEVRGRK